MKDDQEQTGGEEIRSPLQAFVRVVLVIVVVVVLVGFFIAVLLRPEKVVEPEADATGPIARVAVPESTPAPGER